MILVCLKETHVCALVRASLTELNLRWNNIGERFPTPEKTLRAVIAAIRLRYGATELPEVAVRWLAEVAEREKPGADRTVIIDALQWMARRLQGKDLEEVAVRARARQWFRAGRRLRPLRRLRRPPSKLQVGPNN